MTQRAYDPRDGQPVDPDPHPDPVSSTPRRCAAFAEPPRLVETLLRLVWPGRCAASSALLQPDERGPLCAPLREQLTPCGWLAPPPPGLDAALALYRYDPALARAIQRWKYARRQAIGRALGELLAGALVGELGAAPAALCHAPISVVPMPLHRTRLQARGFEQTRALAAGVARALERIHGRRGVALRTHALRRVRATPAQAGLDRAARLVNVQNAFKVDRPLIGAVCLVDDVLTTGATAAAASAALREAGTTTVVLVCVAHAFGHARVRTPKR